MKKQIVLAVLLLAGIPLVAMNSQYNSDQENTESTEQSDELVTFCVWEAFYGLGSHLNETMQSMQVRANNVWQSMQLQKKLNDVLSELMGALVIEEQQEDDEKSEQSENGKNEKDEEIEQLRKQLQKIKDEQIISDEKYAQWLMDQSDEEL